MKKIPTLFVRNPDDRRHVLPEVTPGCEWVLANEGRATRKYDGVCLRMTQTDTLHREWWARRIIKGPLAHRPDGFEAVDTDPTTGYTTGWEPIRNTGWWRILDQAGGAGPLLDPGTYELCGPRVNGNPQGYDTPTLVRHGADDVHLFPLMLDPAAAHSTLASYLNSKPQWEGIVWWHPDGRMAKLKRRDFPHG